MGLSFSEKNKNKTNRFFFSSNMDDIGDKMVVSLVGGIIFIVLYFFMQKNKSNKKEQALQDEKVNKRIEKIRKNQEEKIRMLEKVEMERQKKIDKNFEELEDYEEPDWAKIDENETMDDNE